MILTAMALSDTDPGLGSKPAPGELAYIQAFVNTRNPEEVSDAVQTPDQMREWLMAVGLLPGRAPMVSAADHARLVALREALRQLLLANGGAVVDPEAVALIEREAVAAPAALRLRAGGSPVLEGTGAGINQVVSRLLAAIAVAGVDGTWRRLKACRSDSCLWAFYDASRNGSGAWCTMSECGNRAKARRFRSRHAAHAASALAAAGHAGGPT
ncbi:MAG TPA: CGNR zinc finger domain-containing protein [Candidatus Dormibacteraeota bacterium]